MRALIVIGISVLVSPAVQGQEAKTTKANEFEGAYTITSGEDNGKPAPDEMIKGASVRIAGDTIVVADKDDKEIYVAKYTLDPSKTPISIKMTEAGGPRGRKGQKAEGIIARDGETVKLCYCYEGGIVPSEFKTKAGEKQLCFVMKRKGKDTK